MQEAVYNRLDVRVGVELERWNWWAVMWERLENEVAGSESRATTFSQASYHIIFSPYLLYQSSYIYSVSNLDLIKLKTNLIMKQIMHRSEG
jgi:hypothetical protein